jgi:hypothetical protein
VRRLDRQLASEAASCYEKKKDSEAVSCWLEKKNSAAGSYCVQHRKFCKEAEKTRRKKYENRMRTKKNAQRLLPPTSFLHFGIGNSLIRLLPLWRIATVFAAQGKITREHSKFKLSRANPSVVGLF